MAEIPPQKTAKKDLHCQGINIYELTQLLSWISPNGITIEFIIGICRIVLLLN